jgi:hypothetical protein
LTLPGYKLSGRTSMQVAAKFPTHGRATPTSPGERVPKIQTFRKDHPDTFSSMVLGLGIYESNALFRGDYRAILGETLDIF